MTGRSIRIFLPDGTPGNLFTGEIINWTGRVTVFPRSELNRFLSREESAQPGVYLLLGQDPEDPNRDVVYVGESESLGDRLKNHDRDDDKAFWETTFAASSKDQNLTKAHVRYLEVRLIQLLVEAGRTSVWNTKHAGGNAKLPPLPEADRADMEFFLDQLLMLLPVVGFGHARPKVARPAPTTQPPSLLDRVEDEARFVLEQPAFGVRAEAVEVNGEFVVLAGATARTDGVESWVQYKALRKQFVAQGKFQPTPDGKTLLLQEDTPFGSVSAAAAVLMGRNANGRTEWRQAGTHRTYKDWQEAKIGTPASADSLDAMSS
ncbi:GIY-YIG nuclease family protein [Deinococcus yavapaiensis]|uniref:Uncharacterized protein DUF4357 n=1 Tax=Deinococcus yavapaiensis KR-236 TaxID=694435 RepID=A0A318S425_9DEIO|nr:GIY-YIG nuclease family protein [Deinococcus yavapaiensis]PYE53295.1 uncharacterized protein DUF4357 [Deinococcus yavapaiensis KR-236]